MRDSNLGEKEDSRFRELAQVLRDLGRVMVAFSGGADSSFLAWVATDVLGTDRAQAVTAVSPSLAASERRACSELAAGWGLRWREVATCEMERPEYRRNSGDRCYYCKDALIDALEPLARREAATVVLGVNIDDLADHRPGQRAAAARGARFPLVDAGFTKEMIRSESRRLGLVTWDKPAAPCLASRIPYGTEVSLGVLRRVEVAERRIRQLGFVDLRVRHYGDLARVEVPLVDLPRLLDSRTAVEAAARSAGYRRVTLDPAGLRSGNLNDALTTDRAASDGSRWQPLEA
ncbi:MAG: Pyridinium-3,5-biscarboxylic acid mononucleotide sulfurtransferase [Acidimicrobiales bacterium]|nr:MAG: ATP-dependent sacrificial sulfur transferase LarE [Actinomycetota bacterium]MBV6508502.1 Pyridinium-3,5-biscarboxylic acid mononucleotide sulfurtransferase [Acidimicrobiales bacterium]RIK05182.1 MAG: ATP-dependent sacrificial sulfur transferase LarE [Acidobacteriota bacterium]